MGMAGLTGGGVGHGLLLPSLAGTFAVLVWGATPAATALVVRDIPSALIGPGRLLLSAVLLLPPLLLLRPALPRDRAGWAALAINGLIGFGASFFFQGIGIARTTTAHAALVLTAAPVITALIQFLLARSRPRPLWWGGSVIALLGEAVLILGRDTAGNGAQASIFGDLLVFAGTVTVSIGYVAGAKLAARIGLFAATAWSILFGALFLLPLLPTLIEAAPGLTPLGGGALLFLAVVCTLLGFAAWYWALHRGGVVAMSLLQFAQPVVGLVIAVTLLAEELSGTVLLAVILILSGVFLCRRALFGGLARS